MPDGPPGRHQLDPVLARAFRVWLKGAGLRSCTLLLELVRDALAERGILLRYELVHQVPPAEGP